MFSKFSLDQTDPISKLGAKVEPQIVDGVELESGDVYQGWDFVTASDMNGVYAASTEQKAVVGPKAEVLHWPSLEIRGNVIINPPSSGIRVESGEMPPLLTADRLEHFILSAARLREMPAPQGPTT
jgi:hypothetical protein